MNLPSSSQAMTRSKLARVVAETAPGELLCTVLFAGKRVWTWRGGDLYIYEHALAFVPTTGREAFRELRNAQIGSPENVSAEFREKRAALGRAHLQELLERPGSQIFPAAEIKEALLGRGLVAARLTINVSGGKTMRWVWAPWSYLSNVPFALVERALRRVLGPGLTVG